VNTQLIYRYKQLRIMKETLEAEWTEHKRLHAAALTDVDSGQLQRREDDLHSCHLQPISVRQSRQTDQAGLLRYCDGERSFTTSKANFSADNSLQCRASASVTIRQDPMSSQDFDDSCTSSKLQSQTYEFNGWSDDVETFDVAADDRHQVRSYNSSSLSAFYCVDDDEHPVAVLKPASTLIDVDPYSYQPASRHNNDEDDEDDLEPLLGGDDWWSTDESWSWQCSSSVGDSVNEATRTDGCAATSKNAEFLQTTSSSDLSSILPLNDAVDDSRQHRHCENFLPHVAGLVDDC